MQGADRAAMPIHREREDDGKNRTNLTDGKSWVFFLNFMRKFKMLNCEASLLLLHEKCEIGVNFIFLSRTTEVGMFDKSFGKLS
jgi:hypothetical protein